MDGVPQLPHFVGAAAQRHFQHARPKPRDFVPADEIDDVVGRIGAGGAPAGGSPRSAICRTELHLLARLHESIIVGVHPRQQVSRRGGEVGQLFAPFPEGKNTSAPGQMSPLHCRRSRRHWHPQTCRRGRSHRCGLVVIVAGPDDVVVFVDELSVLIRIFRKFPRWSMNRPCV